VVIFQFLLLSLLFLFACNRTDNRLTESQYYFKDASEILSLHGNWRVTTNPDYDPITNKPGDEFKLGYIPRMWFNAGIKDKYIVSYNAELEISNSILKEKFGLLVFNVINSNEVYINGKLIGQKGKIDNDRTKMRSNASPSLYKIPESLLKKGKNRITIRVADNAGSGGLLEALRICEMSVCEKFYNRFLLITGGTGFFILFIGIYHLVLFLGSREDRAILYFGVGTIFHALTFLGFERIIYFFTDIFLIHFYTMNLSYSFSCILSLLFLHSFLEKKMNWIARFLLVCFSLSTLSSMVAGISLDYRSIHSRYILLLNVMCFVPILSMQVFHLTFKAYKENKVGSNLILFGFAFFILTNLLIPLHILHIIPTKAFTIEGSLLLIVLVTFALSQKTKQTSEKLLILEKAYRTELEKEVNEKTKALEQNNEELQKSNLLKNKLFSIIAHDLRNPLFALEEVIALFQDKHLTTRALKENIASLGETLENNKFLLDNLLQWSYIQLGYSPIKLEQVDIQKLITESVQLYKAFADKKRIMIHVNHSKSHYSYADEGIIRLILRNLISNAIKFTPKNGKIEISYGRKKSLYFISVKDSGIGIPKKKLKNFFLQSQIEKNAHGTEGEVGSGIGLTLCNDFAKRMNGSLTIKSIEKKGSIFTMTWKQNEH
jgi:signal transduction histidine kinase